MRRLIPFVSLLVACRPSVGDEATDDVAEAGSSTAADTETATGTETATDTDTGTETDDTLTTAEACMSVCAGYAACGCEQRCQLWCDSYLDWSICIAEIEALIVCGATHPSPCTWGEETAPDITCMSEVLAFSGCSGNSFFPLPGVPEVCEP